MMEHSCFDFGPLGVEKKVSTLEDFVHFVDDEFDSSSFASNEQRLLKAFLSQVFFAPARGYDYDLKKN